jgi:hypothetical protein
LFLQFGAGENPLNAGRVSCRGHVDAANKRVSVWASNECHMQQAWQAYVVDIRSFSSD